MTDDIDRFVKDIRLDALSVLIAFKGCNFFIGRVQSQK